MTVTSNEELAQGVLAQQARIAKISGLLESVLTVHAKQSEVLLGLQNQLVGMRAAYQVFAELVMASSPECKRVVAAATTQVLERPDVAGNQTFREVLEALRTAATSALRTTPEGRRANLRVVPPSDELSET